MEGYMKFLKPLVLPLTLLAIVSFVNMIYVQELTPDQKEELVNNKFISHDELRSQLQLSDDEPAQDDKQTEDKRMVSNEELLDIIAPQLASRSVEQVGRYISNSEIPLKQEIELLRAIISNDAYGLTHDDAVQLVLDVANTYNPGSAEQKQLFQLFAEFDDLVKKSQPLFMAVEHGYKQTVLPLLAWAIEIASKYPEIQKNLEELKFRALLRAVDEQNLKALQAIHNFAKGVSQEHANELVWHITNNGNSAFLLPELKKVGADINQVRGKMTPLIQAIQNGLRDVVEQLIKLDVDLDKIADIEFGSALQRAIANRDAPMEQLLRRAGARE